MTDDSTSSPPSTPRRNIFELMRRELVAVHRGIHSLRSLLRLGRSNRRLFAGALALNAVSAILHLSILALLFPLLAALASGDPHHLRWIAPVSWIIARRPALDTPMWLILLFIGWLYVQMLTKNAFTYIAGVLMLREGLQISERLRVLAFERALGYGKRYFDLSGPSMVSELVVTSTDWIVSQFANFQRLLVEILSVGVILLLMTRVSWRLTAIVLVVLPLVTFFSGSVTERMRGAATAAAKRRTRIAHWVFDKFAGVSLVQGFDKAAYEQRRFKELNTEESRAKLGVERLSLLAEPYQDVCQTTGLLVIAYGITFIRAVDHFTPEHTLGMLYLTVRLAQALRSLNHFAISMAKLEEPIRRFNLLICSDGKHMVPDGRAELHDLGNGVEFRDLSFGFIEDRPILRNVTFTIERGKSTAVVGATGAGKTTLSNLLLRFYDCPPGSIFIGGRDIREFSSASVRRRLAFVSQETQLFNDTLENNIRYGSLEPVSPERLADVCRATQLDSLVARLPDGLDTLLGPDGITLSGGERQRVAIARALLRDADFLILDEPTSSLDALTEDAIGQALKRLTKGCTLLVIAHRLATIREVDKVVVLNEGRVEEEGAFHALMRTNGLFSRYWKAQGMADVDVSTTATAM